MFNSYYGRLRSFLALALMLVLGASAALAQWTEVSPMGTPRSFPMSAYVNNKLYVFGGVGSAYLKTAQSYNPATDLWAGAAAMTETSFAGYAGVVNGKVYLVGGVANNNSPRKYNSAVFEYDPATNKYTTKAAMPAGNGWFAGATVGNTIFMIGGSTSAGATASVWGYNVTTDTWQQYPDGPFAGYYWTATSIGNTIYLIGGVNASSNTVSKAVYKADVVSGTISTWTKVKDYPLYIYGAGSGVVNNKVYVAGGIDNATGNATDASYSYDPVKDTWTYNYPLPAPEYYNVTMAGDGTTMYYAGGASSDATFKFTEGTPSAIAAIGQTEFLVTVKTGAQKTFGTGLMNNGILPLTGSVDIEAAAKPWLGTSTATINVQPGQQMNLGFTANAAALTQGDYTANVTVNTNDPNNAKITVKVKLFVRDKLVEQPIRVVLEEGTGTWCGWCPYGKDSLDAFKAQFPNNALVLSYHGPANSSDPYAFAEVDALLADLQLQGYPNGAVQRWHWPGQAYQMVDRGVWAEYGRQVLQLQPIAPVAIEVKSYSYDKGSNTVNATVHITTSQALPSGSSTAYAVTAFVTQDSIMHTQHKYLPQPDGSVGQTDITPFYHNDVVRTIYPGAMGAPIALPSGAVSDGVLLPGVEMDQNMTFPVQNIVNNDVDHAHVVFLVHEVVNGQLGDVLQGYSQPLVKAVAPVMAVATNPQVKTIKPLDTATFVTTVKNLTSSPLDVAITRTQNDLGGADWSSWFCIESDCKSPDSSSGARTLQPNETATIKVYVQGGFADKTGEVTLSFSGGGQTVTQKYTTTVSSAGGVNMPAVAGNLLSLEQNVPNPTSGVTRFAYNLATAAKATVEVFTVTGQKVFTSDQGRQEAGTHAFTIDGATLSNGVYTVVITSNGARAARSMTVVH